MKESCIVHNKLDDMQYHDVFLGSFILHRYEKQGLLLFDDFDALMKDAFLLLYKMNLVMDSQQKDTLTYELLRKLKNTHRIGKLRGRTKGNVSSSYIGLKYLLDGLMEYARGKIDIKALQNDLNMLRHLKDELSSATIKALANAIGMNEIFSSHELDLLESLSEENLAPADLVSQIGAFAYGDTPSLAEMSERQDASITSLDNITQSPPNQEDNPITELLERLKDSSDQDNLRDESEIEDNIESKTEIIRTDSDAQNQWRSELKKDLEERFSPYLKSQFIRERDGTPESGQMEIPLNEDSQTDEKVIDDQILDMSADTEPERIDIQALDQALEEKIRSKGQHTGSGDYGKQGYKHLNVRQLLDKIGQLENDISTSMNTLDFENIIQNSTTAIDDFNDTIETLGVDKDSLSALGFDEIISMQAQFKKPKFIQFINKIGRNKLYARKLQYKKRHENSIPIEKVTTSHHIDLLVDEEYINLALDIEAFENDFYDRFLQDNLLTFELVAQRDRRKGPIILCYDGSGSMEGKKIEETQAHIISIMEIARIQKRKLVLIQFASKSEPMYIKEINPLYASARDVMDVLGTFICGGTDFEKPLSKAAEYIKADPHGKSDVLFITDGQCEISKDFKKSFATLKRERKFKLYTIIMHSHTYQDYGDIGDISDEVLDIRRHDIGNWNEETNRKLYTLI